MYTQRNVINYSFMSERKKLKVGLFVPFIIQRKEIDYKFLREKLGNRVYYASKGRYAILHILQSQGIFDGRVAVPAYICSSVSDTLISAGYEIEYYDIDMVDLNGSIESIQELLSSNHIDALIIASIYGNPANLSEIEHVCKENDIVMIDDAAQSFGAILDNRYVGSFGDGGFFSFSPGKPTNAHRGSFFWTSKEYRIDYSSHYIYSKLTYFRYKIERCLVYENHFVLKKVIRFLYLFIRNTNTVNDRMNSYEELILGGAIDINNIEAKEYRRRWVKKFESEISIKGARQLHACRGLPNPCKIVFVFESKELADEFSNYLRKNEICNYRGYYMKNVVANLQNMGKIQGRIVELPIDPYEERMNYLFDIVRVYGNSGNE